MSLAEEATLTGDAGGNVTGVTPEIETARTLMRLPRPEDAKELLSFILENREHLAPWEPTRNEEYYTLSGCTSQIDRLLKDSGRGAAIPFLAWSKEDGRIVARCNFSNVVRGPFQACHLGYSVDHAHQGRGFMFEVAQAAVHYAFDSLGLHRIMANYIPRNHRSERLLLRLGFQKEGYARSYLRIAGVWEDHILTSLINEDEE